MARTTQTGARQIEGAVRVAFGRKLRSWYRRNARDLPWRQTRNPYAILVSELMLQQTQVSRVETKYGEFLALFPTLGHVARASAAHVTEAWQGLGYYARARNLHELAQRVTDGGRSPDERFLPTRRRCERCRASARTLRAPLRRSPTSGAPRWSTRTSPGF